MDFLSEIIARKQQRVAGAKARVPLEVVRSRALDTVQDRDDHGFSSALMDSGRMNLIAEFKRRSPSKGVIRPGANPAEIARSYKAGGAAAISVLTEEDYFDGSIEDLVQVKKTVELPVLRKDFIFDPYQVYEAAAYGADAVLLIVAALDDDSLKQLREVAEDELGLDALVEVHSSTEMERANKCGARVIGVNNRNLMTFEVSLKTSFDLARLANPDALLVSESGLDNAEDVRRLSEVGYRAFLIGEALMRSADPERTLHGFLETARV